MSISTHALLSPEERSRLAAMPELGGGNLLATAMAVHPDPHIPFIRTGRPVINTAGEEQTEFTLAQLDALAQSWSAWYHEQGVGPRDRVALYMADTFAYTIHLNALAQLGAIGVLINSKASPALALGLCRARHRWGSTPTGPASRPSAMASDQWTACVGSSSPRTCPPLPCHAARRLALPARTGGPGVDHAFVRHDGNSEGGDPNPRVQRRRTALRLENYIEPANERMMTAQPQSHLGCIVYTAYSILAGTPLVALYDPSGEELAAAVRQHHPKGSWHSPTHMPSWPCSKQQVAQSIQSTTG